MAGVQHRTHNFLLQQHVLAGVLLSRPRNRDCAQREGQLLSEPHIPTAHGCQLSKMPVPPS